MRTDSERNLSAEADPNPARKTRQRVLTLVGVQDSPASLDMSESGEYFSIIREEYPYVWCGAKKGQVGLFFHLYQIIHMDIKR